MPAPLITFRASSTLDEALTARTGRTSTSLTAQRELERYYTLLADELRTVMLTEPEAKLVVDANNGVLWEPHTMRLLWAGTEDAITGDGLDRKWDVDGPALVAKLRALTPGQTVAVVDAVERYWAAVSGGADVPTETLLRRVGLVRDEVSGVLR